MTKAETHKLLLPHWAQRITRRKKTAGYRTREALLLIGSISALRDLAKLCDQGNAEARLFADICRIRENVVTRQLRKL